MLNFIKKWRLKRLCSLNETAGFIKNYYKQEKDFPNTYMAIDLEMTGLDSKKDKILSIAGHKIINNSICLEDSFEIYIRNADLEATGIAEVHGILSSDIKLRGIPIEDALKEFLKRITGATIVAHGASIDMSFLNREYKKNFNFELINPVIDTMKLVEKYEQGSVLTQNHYTLDKCCKRYNITQTKHHTAVNDAYATALLFLKLRNLS